jgi:hypothetical protein
MGSARVLDHDRGDSFVSLRLQVAFFLLPLRPYFIELTVRDDDNEPT